MGDNNNNVDVTTEYPPITSPGILVRKIFFSILVIIVGLFLLVGAVILCVRKSFFIGLVMIIPGVSITMGAGHYFIIKRKEIKECIARARNYGEKGFIKKFAAIVSLYCVCILLVFAIGVSGYGFYQAENINSRARTILKTKISRSVFDEVAEFDEAFSEESEFVKFFFVYENKYEKYRDKMDEYVADDALKLEKKISKIKPCKEIESVDAYYKRCEELYDLVLDENNSYQKWVMKNVKNYYVLELHIADFEKELEEHEVECSKCKGSGSVIFSCEYCSGIGKNVVTWYEFGDWGEKNYSNYECNKCGGNGKIMQDCSKCDGYGYLYRF